MEKLRLVIDARRSNRWSANPPSVDVATGSSLGGLEVDIDGPLHVGHIDIANVFHNLGLPLRLQRYVGLPSVGASGVGITHLDGHAATPSTPHHLMHLCSILGMVTLRHTGASRSF